MRAILNDTPYPAALFNAIINRIRADSDEPKKYIYKVNYTRAAVIKAFLTRKYRNEPNSTIQEVLCMALNEQSTHPAYLFGRLFAVLEKAQEEAIPSPTPPSKIVPLLRPAHRQPGFSRLLRLRSIISLKPSRQNQ